MNWRGLGCTLHQAVQRGDLIAHLVREGGKRLVVSANSLARWHPQAVRQEAGRQRAALAGASRVQGRARSLAHPRPPEQADTVAVRRRKHSDHFEPAIQVSGAIEPSTLTGRD